MVLSYNFLIDVVDSGGGGPPSPKKCFLLVILMYYITQFYFVNFIIHIPPLPPKKK